MTSEQDPGPIFCHFFCSWFPAGVCQSLEPSDLCVGRGTVVFYRQDFTGRLALHSQQKRIWLKMFRNPCENSYSSNLGPKRLLETKVQDPRKSERFQTTLCSAILLFSGFCWVEMYFQFTFFCYSRLFWGFSF